MSSFGLLSYQCSKSGSQQLWPVVVCPSLRSASQLELLSGPWPRLMNKLKVEDKEAMVEHLKHTCLGNRLEVTSLVLLLVSVHVQVQGSTPIPDKLLVQIPTSSTSDAMNITCEAWGSEASKEGENGVTLANILSNQLVHQTSRRLSLNLSLTETTVRSSLKINPASSQPSTKIRLTYHAIQAQRRLSLPRG